MNNNGMYHLTIYAYMLTYKSCLQRRHKYISPTKTPLARVFHILFSLVASISVRRQRVNQRFKPNHTPLPQKPIPPPSLPPSPSLAPSVTRLVRLLTSLFPSGRLYPIVLDFW